MRSALRVGGPLPLRLRTVRHYAVRPTEGSKYYLQQCAVPTMKFQKGLPRLPIPKLEDSCSRYLAAVEPILSEEEFQHTKTVVQDFLQNDGPKLQEKLKAWDNQNKHTSYISDAWFEMYLAGRAPIPINSNPYLAFKEDTDADRSLPENRVAMVVHSALRMRNSLKAGNLEPDVFFMNPKTDKSTFFSLLRFVPEQLAFYVAAGLWKAFALDMSQYPSLFNATRVPREDTDVLLKNAPGNHIVVSRKGRFYAIDVVDPDGSIATPEEIKASLQTVLNDDREAEAHPVGVLTTMERSAWATARAEIESLDTTNRASLKAIDSAILLVNLDEEAFPGVSLESTDASDDARKLARLFLVGDGRNRWFDKSFSFICTRDGKLGLNFEHAWGDGVCVLRLVNEVYKDAKQLPTPGKVDAQPATELAFKLNDDLKKRIADAGKAFDSFSNSLQYALGHVPLCGKQAAKKAKVSPDAVAQFTIQLAYSRLYKGSVATYESCSTAAFRHGRTETIRPNTTAVRDAVQVFLDPSVDDAAKLASLRMASERHSELTKNAAMGQGFDRHMYMLRYLAEKEGKMPAVFKDPAYGRINHNILSTSTLSSDAIALGGFGPVVPDGFGVGYSVFPAGLGFHVTSFGPQCHDFLKALKDSAADVHRTLTQ